MGRKYGLLQYGRYTYDLFPIAWVPIPDDIFDEIWVPDPGVPAPPVEAWASAIPAVGDIWTPKEDITASWIPSTFGQTEIWIPVTKPVFNA